MPSHRVNESNVTLELFDVLGEDGEFGFIGHTGLAAKEGRQLSDAVEVFHMGPPLETDGVMKVDARGTAKLNDDERHKIEDFRDRHAGEHAATRRLPLTTRLRHVPAIYCIHPHATPHREEDRRYVRTRFSCAGFVFEAYKAARISLLDELAIPRVGLAELKLSYPRFAQMLEDLTFRESMGLGGGTGEWPVMLCGYLLHALSREAAEIRSTPYVPRGTDAYFT